MRGWALRALAGWWLAGAALSGWALEPATPLAEYARQAWVMENGLPQDTVQALTQTRDGFVWIGTEAGLARFDGVAFAVFDKNSNPALPSGDVRCLLETSDGALWVGTSDGLARWQGGAVRTFTTEDGLPGNTILALRVNERGAVLVSTESGTVGIEDSKVVPAAADAGAGAAAFSARLTDGSRAQATVSTVTLTQHGKESQWSVRKELPGSRVQALFADREGCLWIGTNGGLARIVHGVVQRLAVTDPLAGASILTIMEDREGDVWVGTETSGLHILRDQRFRTISMHEGLSSDATTTVVEDGKGALWIGTSGGALNVFRRSGVKSGAASVYAVRDVLLSDVILSLAAAPNGDLWVGTPDGLNRIRGSAVDAYTSADGLPDDFIRSLLVDADGSLWIGTRRGLAHWMFPAGGAGREHAAAKIVTYTQASGLGSDLVGAMARDKAGDLWVATFAGLSRLHGGAITNYTTANGLSSNVVTALLARPSGELFIGTQDHGWNLWDGHSFSAPKGRGLSEKSIHAILDDAGNHLWFATDEGIARCDCTMTAECTHWIEFGPADGLRSRETATNSHPSAWRSRDGLLWFATPKGLVEADPAYFAINTEPPLVAIERFAVDDVEQPLGDGAGLRLQAGHVHFEFDYAGLSFVAPQKVRYRYMLEGFDKQWTEAGARRTAYYTNIPPGRYVLRVQAANNDGVWNEQGAALRFELRPHFYQTIWFYLVLAVLLGALVVVLLRLRLMRAEREFRAVLGERSRIAREIHDTLAQGYVGISVQLEVLAELLRQNKSDAAAKQLDTARSQVRDGLADARQSIWALRSQDSGEKTLPVELRRVTEQAGGHGLEANFSIYGAYRALPPGTEREILRVAQEAIHNVKKHAGARNLTVQLEYRQNEIALEVRDDGRGFAAEGGAESPPGHFGLTGMRERAAAIKGVLDVTSETGGGTTVRLRVPARKEQKEST